MTEKEIAEWLAQTYEKEKTKEEKEGAPAHKHGITRSEGTTGTISIMTGGEIHHITKQALADNLNNNDNLASEIWHWILP